MKEPKPKTETENVGSTDPENVGSANLAPRLPGEGAAQNAPTQSSALSPQSSTRDRQDALDEAAKLCGDLRNSIEAIGAFAITGHTDVVRDHYKIYIDRAKNLHALLAQHIENLPAL